MKFEIYSPIYLRIAPLEGTIYKLCFKKATYRLKKYKRSIISIRIFKNSILIENNFAVNINKSRLDIILLINIRTIRKSRIYNY